MFVNPDISFIRDSQNATNLVISLNDLYYSIRQFCNRIIAIIIAIPVLIVAYLILLAINRRWSRLNTKNVELSLNNYKDLKITQSKLNGIADKLDRVKSIDLKRIPLLFKPFFIQVRKLSVTVDKYRNSLNFKFISLDKTDVGIFKVVPENKLWNDRIPVYDYLV